MSTKGKAIYSYLKDGQVLWVSRNTVSCAAALALKDIKSDFCKPLIITQEGITFFDHEVNDIKVLETLSRV